MISSIEWIRAGVAASVPKRYEMSEAERELIQLMEEKGSIEQVEAKLKASIEPKLHQKRSTGPSSSDLPADLRMDEYSSEEDEDGAAIGSMLLGKDVSVPDDLVPDEDNHEEQHEEQVMDRIPNSGPGSDDSDYDSDDDLADVPDTREFEPVDVDGLQAMGLSQVGINGGTALMEGLEQDDAEDSDAEDVRITEDDALVLVAKTEDVSISTNALCSSNVVCIAHNECLSVDT